MNKDIKIRFIGKDERAPENSLVCAIDVIRASSTAATALENGAEKIIAVSTKEQAFELKEKNPDYLIMGEKSGLIIEGFDYGNSPFKINEADIKGKTLIQKTAAGTDGIVNNLHAKKVIVGTFLNAEATYNYIEKYIAENEVEYVVFAITNSYKSAEDVCFANYISEKLFGNENVKVEPYLEIIRNCKYATTQPWIETMSKDVEFLTQVDKFDFVMDVEVVNGFGIIKKLN